MTQLRGGTALSTPIGQRRRAALYVRVSTPRQAEGELSIPDQIKQGEDFCAAHDLELVDIFVEPGLSATDDHRPAFQRADQVKFAHIRRELGIGPA